MFISGALLVYAIYALVTELSDSVTQQSYSDFTQSSLLFAIGVLNGVLNFVLSRVYEFIIVYLVDWENHM